MSDSEVCYRRNVCLRQIENILEKLMIVPLPFFILEGKGNSLQFKKILI
jgi:hypothetical protein